MRYFRIACNFEPSCSEYTRQAVLDQGTIRALKAGFLPLRRCNQPDLVKVIADPYNAQTRKESH